MSLRSLPEVRAFAPIRSLQWDTRDDAMARWAPEVRAAEAGREDVISIYDVIGEDFWTGEGFTSKRLAGALRSIGERDVTVNINSPGGDFFEGVAIYNLLREHRGRVTVKVMGLAASAASIIAMAGDEILIGRASFVMIHNAWGVSVGNRHDLRSAADMLEPFDDAMADVYAARSGKPKAEMAKLMDAETWFNGAQAVERGLADGFLSEDEIAAQPQQARAEAGSLRTIDRALAKQGVTRSERRALFATLRPGTQDAAEPATRDAGPSALAADLRRLLDTVKG